MAGDDAGLPPPAPPPPRVPTPIPEPRMDLEPGFTRAGLETLRESSAVRGVDWDQVRRQTGDTEAPRSFTAFSGTGPDALQSVQSLFENAVSGDKPDPSTMGLLRAIAGGIGTGLNNPIAAITDEYQVAQIRELQENFLRENGPTLIGLSDSLANGKRAMRELGEIAGEANISPVKLGRLLDEKARLGNRTLYNIERALETTEDPKARERLTAMRDDLKKWMAERDARVAAEHGEVSRLRMHLDLAQQELLRQARLLEEAAWSPGPTTSTTGRSSGGPVRVVDSTHTRPDAVDHVTSLHRMLLGARGALIRAVTPSE